MTKWPLSLGFIAYVLGSAALVGASPASIGTEIGQRIPQFEAELIDVSGPTPKTRGFDSHQNERITAYVFVGTTCPATAAYGARFLQFEQTYGAKDVQVIYVYPNRDDTSEAKRSFHKGKQWNGPFIDDEGGRLAHLFEAQRTTEIFLVGKDGTVLFHGGFDDNREDPTAVKQRYLATAIDEHLAGKPVSVAQSQVFA